MPSLLSSNFSSCKPKSCSCLASNAHDTDLTPVIVSKRSSKVHTLSDRTVPATLLKTSAIDIELSDSPPSLVCKLKGIGIFCPDPTKRIISSRNESVRLEGATFELCKGGIAGLGDSRAHISQDPDAAREALSMSKGEHTRDRVCSLAAHSALGAQLLDTLHAQLSAQKTLAQESDMRDGLLNSLRQIRAQYTDVSRKLRNALVVNCSLTAELEKERAARVTAESALANLASKNLTLIEHNKVLLGREPTLPNDSFISHRRSHLATDSHLQVAIPARMAIPMSHSRQSSISEAYQPQAFLAEPSLRQLEGSSASGLICWTTEFRRAALRTKLIAAENELHIAKQHLAISERRCDTLSTKVSSLQANLTICVDECSRALAVERELRYEVEARVHDLWCKAQSFEDQGRDLETEADCKPFPVKAWRQTGGYVRQMNAISMAAFDRCDALERDNLKQNDIIAELSKKIADHENLVKGVDILGQDIARYKGTIAELETRVRERFEDRYYRLKARKRLMQLKRKKKEFKAKTSHRQAASSSGIVHDQNQAKTDVQPQSTYTPAPVPYMKTVVERAKRISRALTDFSIEFVNSSSSPSFDPSLNGMHFA